MRSASPIHGARKSAIGHSSRVRPMREIRLHDTRSGQRSSPRAPRSGPRGHLRLRADGLQPHPHRQRPAVRRVLPAQALPGARGLRGRRSSSTSPTSTTRSTTPRGPAGVPSARAGRRDDRGLPRRHRPARASAGPTTSRWPRRRSGRSSTSSTALVERGHAYESDGDVYFRVRSDPAYGALSHRDVEQMDQGEGVEGRDARRTRSTSRCGRPSKAGEDTAWDSPWGRGRPGWHIECSAMAEELLGVGLRHPRRRIGPRLPAPRERGGPDALRARRASSRGSGCTTGCSSSAARRWPSRSGTSSCSPRPSSAGAATRWSCSSPPATTASRSSTPDDDARRRRGPRRRIRDVGAARCRPASRRTSSRRIRDAFFDALADDFNTPAGARRSSAWMRARASRRRGRRRGPARDARRARAREPARARPRARRRRPRAARAPPGRARGERDFAEADRLRDELTARGWEVRDTPGGAELVAAGS